MKKILLFLLMISLGIFLMGGSALAAGFPLLYNLTIPDKS